MFAQIRRMKHTLLLAGLLTASAPLWAAEYWIDVRVPEQYQQEHVKGAHNIPLSQMEQRIASLTQDKNDTLHLYCNSGHQSGKAQQLLQEMGYQHAINEGGLKQVAKSQEMVK
ncbi:thiosulfate sulfurtransferase PspE [Edwardsiella tarda]|uniref:Phage shock operon rhodanese PspE n=1 Tax=Edwardsiella tarda ATCC 23685 TaxID=500638 RepID=D4F2J7_EDWTA|nr:thiosulfate sulfurtransferase PspE [Edwardsiella tarda]EFE24025.1 phage shock operon rhodanese PspE [Edwardsiella tarda ATCC 23685]WKS80498.1 thiosulfate sulfurtransferase PspE [Edwardsiella tarda]GAC64449.1 thiosulfate sulfurtransferase PspE [Edwardsiella tarda ATCC 15947 = NBRC 105688]STD48422.1 Thiosulfate sulfurtransferase PspE precursor [Edwardsiella tarda]